MTLPHYTDPLYESARQRRRYQTDPAYRLDRINRARQRLGLSPYRSLASARIRFRFERCRIDAPRLRRQRIIAGLPVASQRTNSARRRFTRLAMLRERADGGISYGTARRYRSEA